MIYNRFNKEISCHHITASLCQSVICLAPCHQTSQSFALPLPPNQLVICLAPATKPVSHLTCILPLCHCITVLVSHLPCPLPPYQSVICLAPCHQTSQSFDLPSTTALPCHRITVTLHHHITVSLCQSVICFAPLPPNQSVICLAPCHQTSQSFALPLPPNQSVICLALYHCITASPRHCITALPHHCTTMSPCHHTTASQCHHVTASPCHHVTMSVSHLPCPLPPNQSVICLGPCHQTSQSFDLPTTTASLHHRVTTSPHNCITVSDFPHHMDMNLIG